MGTFITAGMIKTALDVGLIYGLVAMSLFVSYSILNICDLSTDGCYTLGSAVGAVVTIAGHPVLAVFLAMLAGICSGFITAELQTRFQVESILAGIIVNTALYTINLAVMGFSSNLSIFGTDTVFSLVRSLSVSPLWQDWSSTVFLLLLLLCLGVLLHRFLGTRMGLSIRATGDSPAMVRASSINPAVMIIVGLCIANAFTGLSGSLIAQYNKTSDINLGTGMVTIALASLVIGESFFRRYSLQLRIFGVVFGSILYRVVISLALRLKVPTEAFKLVSALIVAIAIILPRMKEGLVLQSRRRSAMRKRKEGSC